MSPEQIIEADKGTRDETTSETGLSNGTGLNESGDVATSDIVPSDSNQDNTPMIPEELALMSLSRVQVLLPTLFNEVMQEFTDEKEAAQNMFRRYSDIAINNADADLSTVADQLACEYLKTAISASSNKKDLIKTLIQVGSKGMSSRPSSPRSEIPSQINVGEGGSVNINNMSRRELIQAIEEAKEKKSEEQ